MITNLLVLTNTFSTTSDPRLQRGFAQIINSLVTTKSCIMSEWARSAYNFAAFVKKCYRFFRNPRIDWQISQTILQFLLPRFDKKKYIPVLIDPSFIENKILGVPTKTRADQEKATKGFYLLSAALPVRGRAISFFQSRWRNTQINYLIEDSFNKLIRRQLIKIINLLKPVLSKAVFIMDRGFGYDYFFKTFIDLNVNYVVRIRDINTHVVPIKNKRNQKKCKIKDLVARVSNEPIMFTVLYKETTPLNIVISKRGNHAWVLATSLGYLDDTIRLYAKRMKIEEAFKDWKSTGFDIEKMLIRQWDLVPKLIWCVVIAHMILYLLGEAVAQSKKYRHLLKRFIQKKESLSYVQLAWKVWLYDFQSLKHFINRLFLTLQSCVEAI